MKHLLSLGFLLTLFHLSAQKITTHYFGESKGMSSRCNQTINLPDGGLLMVGISNLSDSSGIRAMAIRSDFDGNTLWQKHFSLGEFNCAVAHPDGGFVLGGMALTTVYGNYAGIVVRIDEQGNRLWQYQSPETERTIVSGICVKIDGTIVACGTTAARSQADAFLLFLDKEGRSIKYTTQHLVTGCITGVAITPSYDNGVYEYYGNDLGLLAKYDEKGEKVWRQKLERYGFMPGQYQVSVGPDSTLILQGMKASTTQAMILGVSPAGALRWKTEIAGEGDTILRLQANDKKSEYSIWSLSVRKTPGNKNRTLTETTITNQGDFIAETVRCQLPDTILAGAILPQENGWLLQRPYLFLFDVLVPGDSLLELEGQYAFTPRNATSEEYLMAKCQLKDGSYLALILRHGTAEKDTSFYVMKISADWQSTITARIKLALKMPQLLALNDGGALLYGTGELACKLNAAGQPVWEKPMKGEGRMSVLDDEIVRIKVPNINNRPTPDFNLFRYDYNGELIQNEYINYGAEPEKPGYARMQLLRNGHFILGGYRKSATSSGTDYYFCTMNQSGSIYDCEVAISILQGFTDPYFLENENGDVLAWQILVNNKKRYLKLVKTRQNRVLWSNEMELTEENNTVMEVSSDKAGGYCIEIQSVSSFECSRRAPESSYYRTFYHVDADGNTAHTWQYYPLPEPHGMKGTFKPGYKQVSFGSIRNNQTQDIFIREIVFPE